MPWPGKLRPPPPLLHLEIGMVNQAWEAFEGWVDDVIEVVPPIEKDAQKEAKMQEKK
jgi:hypothetical protein